MIEGQVTMPDSLVLDRVFLRSPRLEDSQVMYDGWASDPEVTRYLIWSPHRSADETSIYLAHTISAWSEGAEFTWMICSKSTLKPLGTISLVKHGFKAGVGFALGRQCWGQGLVPEAGASIVRLALSDPMLQRIGAVCDIDNIASARALHKIGLSREGLLRRWLVHPTLGPNPRDCISFSHVRGDPSPPLAEAH